MADESPTRPEAVSRRAVFGEFELDLETAELRRDGEVVPLASQTARVLVLLAQNFGRLVTRQALIDDLWPDVVVEYDQGLNSLVRSVRNALGDDSRNPRFVETVPRRGYRFVAPTEIAEFNRNSRPTNSSPSPAAGLPEPVEPVKTGILGVRRWSWIVKLSLAASVALWFTVPLLKDSASLDAADQPQLSVAVLPFGASSNDGGHLAVSLANALAHELVQLSPRIQIVGDPIDESLLRETRDPSAVAMKLGATHILSGTVDDLGDRVSWDLQLKRVDDHQILWRQAVEPGWDQLSLAEKDLAQQIAARLIPGAHPDRRAAREVKPEVFRDYLEAKKLLARQADAKALGLARRLLQRAVDRDSSFSEAQVALAEAMLRGGDPADRQEAYFHAIRAVQLDPQDHRAHLLRSRLALESQWSWRLAERHVSTAEYLAPSDPSVLLRRAHLLASLGQHGAARRVAEQARRLDPLSATVLGDLAMLRYWEGDDSGLLREIDLLLTLEPDHNFGRFLRAEALLRLEDWPAARRELVGLMPSDAPELERAIGSEVGQRYFEINSRLWKQAPASPEKEVALAEFALRRGDKEGALEHLAEAVRLKSPYAPYFAVDPTFQELRGEAEFAELMRRIGHPGWSANGRA